jgi:PAS domain-containing protein
MSPLQRAWKIAGIYAGFGVLWILLSDHLLGLLATDPASYAALQPWKGSFYVVVTALLVVTLARRAFQEQQDLLRRSQESEDRLRAIFDGVGDAIFLHDSRTGRILQANSTGEALFG